MAEFRWTLYTGNTSEVLTIDPEGWEDAEITLRRDRKYHGVFKEFTIDLKFVCNGGGKEFIEEVYETQGTEADIRLVQEYLCSPGGDYDTLFVGLLDLSKFIESGEELQVKIVQEDIGQRVLNRIETPVNLLSPQSINGAALPPYTMLPYNLDMHSKVIFLRGRLENLELYNETNLIDFTTTQSYNIVITPFLALAINDLQETSASNSSVAYGFLGTHYNTVPITPFYDSTGMIPSIMPQVVNVSLNITGTYNDIRLDSTRLTTVDEVFFMIRKGQSLIGSSVVYTGVISTGYSNGASIPFSLINSVNITLNPGDKMWCFFEVYGYYYLGAPNPQFSTIEFIMDAGAFIELNTNSTTPATVSKAIAIHEGCARVCEAIADTSPAFYSTLFGRTNSEPTSYDDNGCGSFLAFTSGVAIRQFPIGTGALDKTISTSLNDLFETLNALYCIGLGVETQDGNSCVVMEKISYFYNDTIILSCPNINNLERKIDTSYIYNEAKFGYASWESEYSNGIDEFATMHNYATRIRKVKNAYKAVSPFIASPYSIEVTRRQDVVNFPTTDFKYDNDNFIIALNRNLDEFGDPNALDQAEKDENFDAVNNLIVPETAYNLRYSPARNLTRHMYMLSAPLTKIPGDIIQFQSGEGNVAMATRMLPEDCEGNYGASSLYEDQKFAWNDTNIEDFAPLWVPEVYTFEYKLSYTEYLTIKNNPKGTIRFSRTDNYISGYILEIKYKIHEGLANFTLLRKYDQTVIDEFNSFKMAMNARTRGGRYGAIDNYDYSKSFFAIFNMIR